LTQKPSVQRKSKRIEKPPKKVPIKKQKLEEKKKTRKLNVAAKEAAAKESAPKVRNTELIDEQFGPAVEAHVETAVATEV